MGTVCVADFDGTLTELDVVDSLLLRFAKGREWIAAEREWADGRLSSAECLKKQLASVRVTKPELAKFLRGVKIDPGFAAFARMLRREEIPLVVLSDGFDLLIRAILAREGAGHVAFRSNKLRHAGSRLSPSFPFLKDSCGRCAHCKKISIARIRESAARVVFIGDGLSDVCAAASSDAVFAKGKLAQICRKSGIDYVPFKGLADAARKMPACFKRLDRNTPGKTNEITISSSRR